jgi:hypothetical protein
MKLLNFINKYQDEIIFDLKLSNNFKSNNCNKCLIEKCNSELCIFESKDLELWYNKFKNLIQLELINIWDKRINIIFKKDFVIESYNYSNTISSELYGSNFETDETFHFIINDKIYTINFSVNFNYSYNDGSFINDIININIDNLSQIEIFKFIETHLEKVKNDDNKELLQFIVDISN